MRKNRILLDCDGVLSDFVTPTLELVQQKTGDKHTVDEITQWDVFAAIGKKDKEHILDEAVATGGFCRSFPVLPGSIEAVNELRALAKVIIVTSPYDAPCWVYERTRWLKEHFGFNKKEIANVPCKEIVDGDVLIDDSEKNLNAWLDEYPDRLAILIDRPWNRSGDSSRLVRTRSWDEVLDCVKALYRA